MISFVAYGLPQPGGSKRPFIPRRKDGSFVKRANGSIMVNTVDANPKAKDWKQAVAWGARAAHRGELLSGPLCVVMTFFRPRPASHYLGGDQANGLSKAGRSSAHPTSRPDVLKLARAAEDALTGVLWVDDAQTVRLVLDKQWGQPARVEIHVTPYVEGPPGLTGSA